MGRGRSSSGSSRGFSSSGSRGRSSWSSSSSHSRGGLRTSSRTTVIIGGGYNRGVSSYSGGSYNGGTSRTASIVLGIIFAIFGSIIMIPGFIQCSQYFKYDTTTAVCVDNVYSHGWYYTLYDYSVDGKFYNDIRSNQGWEFAEDVGATVKIYYLKSDPSEISEDCPVSLVDGLWLVGFGVIFGGVGIAVLVSGIKKHKKSGNAEFDNVEISSSRTLDESPHTYCSYCGAKYDKHLNSCPKCGAGK